MVLAAETLPNDVATLQAIIARQAAELEDAKNRLKARVVSACTRLAAKVGPAMPDLWRCAPANRDIAALRPIADLIARSALTATHLHCDDTIIPVLAPKTSQVKKGRSIGPPVRGVILRDGRPYQGADPPVVVDFYSPDRKGNIPACRPMASPASTPCTSLIP